MIAKNVLNPEKHDKIIGNVFHLFYPDLNTSYLFDSSLVTPIIWGSKNIVMTQLKNIHKLLNVKNSTKIYVISYIMGPEGYRRIQTYNGTIKNIGKYIIRY